MAKDDTEIELDSADKKGRGKLILIIVIVVLLISGATLGALYFTGIIGGSGGGDSEASDEQEQTEAAQGPAIYFELTPEFVVNFEGQQKASYLQVDIQLMTRDPEAVNIFKEHAPLIRNNILLLLSGQKYEELRTMQGKEKMRAEVLKAVQQVVEKELGRPAVEAVYFTSFIMQ
jgi:flagellar FliL protein